MKKFIYLTVLLLAFAVMRTNAQARIPGASTTQTITQDFGLGKVIITYSRPNIKGRKIFGALQPYGEVWRTGANLATTIKFTEDVIIEGNKVAAGEYSFFTIPGATEWTIILNKTVKQWGAYTYKQADDLLRFKVKPLAMSESLETFTIQFDNATTKSMDMNLMWEKTNVPIRMMTDDDAKVMANIDTLMQTDPKGNAFDAIQYYYQNNKDMKKALLWAQEREKDNTTLPYYIVWEARVRLKMGDKQGAITTARRGIEVSRAAKDEEYERLNQMVIDQASK